MSQLVPVVLSGGAGTRLWPVSREAMPKPFMRLPDGMSLLQKTFSRASSLPGVERVLTVTNREVVFRTQDEYRQVGTQRIALDFILEPFGRNTAPAIAAAALHCARLHGEDSLLLVAAGHGAGHPTLGWAAALLAMSTAYVRALGGAIGLPQDFSGPMAKQHRMAVITAAAVLSLLEPFWSGHNQVLVGALWLIALGAAITTVRRAANIVRQLRAGR